MSFIDLLFQNKLDEAKEVLNDLLSSRAFEALDVKKTELAQSLFGSEETEENTATEE